MSDAFRARAAESKLPPRIGNPPQDKPEPPTYKVFCDDRVWEVVGWPKVAVDPDEPVLLFYDTPGNYEYGELVAGFTRWEAFQMIPIVMRERDVAEG